MANTIYPLARQAWADGGLSWSTDDWRIALLNGTYVYSDLHEFLDDVNAAQVDVSGNLTGKTNVDGICDADDVLLPAVTLGSTVEGVVLYQWSGLASTSRVAVYWDSLASAQLITFNTDGGDVVVKWSDGPLKMFRL